MRAARADAIYVAVGIAANETEGVGGPMVPLIACQALGLR